MGGQEISMIGFYFQKTNVGSHVLKNKFLPYKLIGKMLFIQCDHGFILPSKVKKMDYQDTKHIWNCIQFSTRMSMERAFGMLKSKFKFFNSKRVNIPFCHMLDLVIDCICLHNMCIANLDDFNMDWALKVQKIAQIQHLGTWKKLIFFGLLKDQSNK